MRRRGAAIDDELRTRGKARLVAGEPDVDGGDVGGIATRFSATFLPPNSIAESSAPTSRIMPVSIMPGWTEFTRIPRGPSSSAAAFVKPRTANFDEV